MKSKELLKRLHTIVQQKNQIKKLVQAAFDEIHKLEVETLLLIEDLEKEGKK